jgi:hypothetical protein
MKVSSMKAARLHKLDTLPRETRVLLYRRALDAWKGSMEQREMDLGASQMQAQVTVREKHETSLRQGYPKEVKAERDAFMDSYVVAAIV